MKTTILFFILLGGVSMITCLGGIFELRLKSYSNPSNRDAEGRCCSLNESDCRSKCVTRFRICVKNYQVSIDPTGGCYFGEVLSDVVEFTSASGGGSGSGGGHVFHFPFNFRWPGTFSLIIEAFTTDQPPPSQQPTLLPSASPQQQKNTTRLLSRMAIQQYLDIGDDFKGREWRGAREVGMKYEYRVRCLPDYYGEACDKTCRPRDDKFGHYTCTEGGDVRCLEGWRGDYCESATCSALCHPVHGYCTTPSTCTCHQGWEGPNCSQCTRYPGCKHGRCTKPFQCECDEGWGGLFCNQDLNYCTNHRPCLNGGTCFNTGQGSYTCECAEGFEGGDCEVWRGGRRKEEGELCECRNGGSCRTNTTTTFCACPEPFTGPSCTDTLCACANGGTCLKNKCICPPNYHGEKCEISVCPLHCNTGQCVVIKNEPQCQCPLGYSDPHCSMKINICATLPCANGGTCFPLEKNQFKCQCKNGFHGDDCSDSCSNCTRVVMEMKVKDQELTTEHVLFVVVASIATPLMVVVAVFVVWTLKRRKEIERRRNDELARRQNEVNQIKGLGLDKVFNDFTVSTGNVKKNNLLFYNGDIIEKNMIQNVNVSIPDLLIDPYNPPPPPPLLPSSQCSSSFSVKLNNSAQCSPVILKENNVNLATEV